MTGISSEPPPKAIQLFEKTWILIFALTILNLAPDLSDVFGAYSQGGGREATIGLAIVGALVALQAWLVISITRGRRNWAKWVLCLLLWGGIANSIRHPELTTVDGPFHTVMHWAQLSLQAFSTVLLFTPPFIAWLSRGPQTQSAALTHGADPTTQQNEKVQCGACKSELTGGQKYCPSCGIAAAHTSSQTSRSPISNTTGSIISVIALVLLGSYVFISLKDSVDLSVSVRPVRPGADAEVMGLVRVTNLSASPVVVQQVSINGRTDSGCVVKATSTLKKGESFDASPNQLFGFSSCGKVLQVTVVTDLGARDYQMTWN